MKEEFLELNTEDFVWIALRLRNVNKNIEELYNLFANGLDITAERVPGMRCLTDAIGDVGKLIVKSQKEQREMYEKLLDGYCKEEGLLHDVFDEYFSGVTDDEIAKAIRERKEIKWNVSKRVFNKLDEAKKGIFDFEYNINQLFCAEMGKQKNCKEIDENLLYITKRLKEIGGCT